MSLTVQLALVFHVFIAVAVAVMVCGRRGLSPSLSNPQLGSGWEALCAPGGAGALSTLVIVISITRETQQRTDWLCEHGTMSSC